MATAWEIVQAEALFASCLQASQRPAAAEVTEAIAETLRRCGAPGCAAAVAAEYGERPETAAARMSWALATVCRRSAGLVEAA